jgi:hypothetical protein
MSYNDEDWPSASDTARFSWKVLLFGGLAIVLVLLFATMWVFGYGLWSAGTAETRGETGVRERTVADADYRIASYDQFYDLCASIVSKEDSIALIEQDVAGAEEGSQRKRELDEYLLALRAQRAELINQYNADARKEDTRANFRASDLPYQIDKEGSTTCENTETEE